MRVPQDTTLCAPVRQLKLQCGMWRGRGSYKDSSPHPSVGKPLPGTEIGDGMEMGN